MEFDPRDQDIIKLLTKLRDVHPEYPENLLVARRQSFLKRIAELELGVSGGPKIRRGRLPHVLPAAGLLETALLAVIVIEASAMAYFYRAKVADFFQTFTKGSKTEEVTPPPAAPTSLQVQGVSPSPAITSTAIVESPSETALTPASTPIPSMAGGNSNTPGAPSLKSTPDPKGNNGHHYGQTPKPERTKEKNGNKDKNGNPPPGNNDKPPKDKPPKNK